MTKNTDIGAFYHVFQPSRCCADYCIPHPLCTKPEPLVFIFYHHHGASLTQLYTHFRSQTSIPSPSSKERCGWCFYPACPFTLILILGAWNGSPLVLLWEFNKINVTPPNRSVIWWVVPPVCLLGLLQHMGAAPNSQNKPTCYAQALIYLPPVQETRSDQQALNNRNKNAPTYGFNAHTKFANLLGKLPSETQMLIWWGHYRS